MRDLGWVKLYRKTLLNEIFLHDPTAWRIFEFLLLSCDSRSGEFTTGRYWISRALNIKPTTVYKALLRLRKVQMITITSNNKYSSILISNWSSYQSLGNTTDNNKVTTKYQQSNTKQEYKNKELRNTNRFKIQPPPDHIPYVGGNVDPHEAYIDKGLSPIKEEITNKGE